MDGQSFFLSAHFPSISSLSIMLVFPSPTSTLCHCVCSPVLFLLPLYFAPFAPSFLYLSDTHDSLLTPKLTGLATHRPQRNGGQTKGWLNLLCSQLSDMTLYLNSARGNPENLRINLGSPQPHF